MSFILDALRKSEHERQRSTGPALAEAAVAPPRPRSNVWATAAIALLLVNLLALGVLLIRKAGREPQVAAPVVATPAPSTTAAAGPAPPLASLTRTVTTPAPSPAAPPMLQPATAPDPGYAAERNPLQDEVSGGSPALDPEVVAQAAAAPPGPPAVTRAPAGRGTVVYESLPDSAALGAPPSPGAAAPTAPAANPALPTADEVVAAGGVPALNLELHVYSTRPGERMVFVNSRKYREGDTLQEGPVVRQITPEGAILEYRGSRFLLSHD